MSMYTLRIIVVLFIIALFLPSTEQEKQRVYSGVSTGVEYVQTFCVRNASFCGTVGSLMNAVAQRVYYSAQMIYDVTVGRPTYWERQRPYPTQSEQRAPRRESGVRPRYDRSRDTLRRNDRDPAWRGPGAS